MGRCTTALRLLTVAGALCLSACGGSGSSNSAGGVTASKSAAWTNVNIRALDGTININWDRPAGSTLAAEPAYNIYCSTDPTGLVQTKNRIASSYTGTSFDHTGLTNGQRYYYAVTQVTAEGEGPASRVVSAAPQAVLPATPNGLKVTAIFSSISSVKLEFTGPLPPNPDSVTYTLYRSTSKDFTTDVKKSSLTSFTKTPYFDRYLDNTAYDTTYYYAIGAAVLGKESRLSPIASARAQKKAAAVNSGLQLGSFASPGSVAAEPGNGSCALSWADVGTIDTSADPTAAQLPAATPWYVIYWSDSPDDVIGNNLGHIDDAAKNLAMDAQKIYTYPLQGLTNGKTYYLQVVAAVKDAEGKPISGRSTPGPVVSVTPAAKTPAIPSGLSATQGSQQVSLTWNKDTSGIAGVTYNVYYSTTRFDNPADVKAKGEQVNNNGTNTKAYFTHSGLEAGKTYYYVVTSMGEAESEPSSVISVTL